MENEVSGPNSEKQPDFMAYLEEVQHAHMKMILEASKKAGMIQDFGEIKDGFEIAVKRPLQKINVRIQFDTVGTSPPVVPAFDYRMYIASDAGVEAVMRSPRAVQDLTHSCFPIYGKIEFQANECNWSGQGKLSWDAGDFAKDFANEGYVGGVLHNHVCDVINGTKHLLLLEGDTLLYVVENVSLAAWHVRVAGSWVHLYDAEIDARTVSSPRGLSVPEVLSCTTTEKKGDE